MADNHQMTRREYREQMKTDHQDHGSKTAGAQESLFHHPVRDESHDDLNIDEQPLLKRQPLTDNDEITDDADLTDDVQPNETREENLARNQAAIKEEKTNHLKIKLNRIIILLIVLIILVYLVLFFVG